jgi:Trypsin-like serine proteases, typically periplasmic, contain C-terminal PDZ domain
VAVTANGARGSRHDGESSPWWSDALNDPWRDPDSPAVIVAPPPEPAVPPPAPPQPPQPVVFGARSVVVVAVLVGLLAGLLGGGVGYLVANARQESVVLGAEGGPPPSLRMPGSLPDVVRRAGPSVVTVTATTGRGESIGSGFVIGKDGYILTNEHVVYGAPNDRVSVTFSDGTSEPATVVGRDTESDIAVLRVAKTPLAPVLIGDSDRVSAGDGVFAIGTPLGLAGTVTMGIVSAVDRPIEARDAGGVSRYYAAIQTDAPVNRGSSGGPLFDLAGRVIGVNSVIKSLAANGSEAGNIGIAFAIPINQAMRVATDLIDTGRARRTVVGASVDSYDGPGGGVRITSVDEAGPAAAAGLRAGDIVIRIDRHVVEQPHDLIALVRRHDPGTTVTIVYRRGGTVQNVSVVLAADAQ